MKKDFSEQHSDFQNLEIFLMGKHETVDVLTKKFPCSGEISFLLQKKIEKLYICGRSIVNNDKQ